MLLSAPLFALPSPWPLLPLCVVPALWLAIWLVGGEPLVRTPLNIPILVIAVMILVSTWATYDLKVSIGYIAGAVLGLGAFFTVARYAETPKGWWFCFFFYFGINILLAVVVTLMVQLPQKIGLLTPITSHLASPVIALHNLSELPHPNTIPAFLLGILPLQIVFTVSALVHRKRWVTIYGWKRAIKISLLFIESTVISGFILLLSQSRGGYISFAVSCLFLILAVLHPRRRWLLLGGTAVAAVVIVALWQWGDLASLQENLRSSLSDDPALSLDNLKNRIEIWSWAIFGIQDFPFMGIGMNTFEHVMPVLYPHFHVAPDVVNVNAHNTYLQAALDLGIPGLIAFLGVQFGSLWMLFKIWRTVSRWQDNPQIKRGFLSLNGSEFLAKAIVLGLGGGILAYMVFGLTESIGLGVYLLIWTLIGLIAGLFRHIQSTQQNGVSSTVREVAMQRGEHSS